jgi:hypothetical protein
MEHIDLTLSLYGCLILLAVVIESLVQGLRKGKTKNLFGLIHPIALATILSLLLTMTFRLQFFNIMFSAMMARIPWWLDSFCLGLVIARGTSWIHEKANELGMNRNPDGSRK